MLHIDAYPDNYFVNKSVEDKEFIHGEVQRVVMECFASDQSPEFYAGLVAGLRAAVSMLDLKDPDAIRHFITASLVEAACQLTAKRENS